MHARILLLALFVGGSALAGTAPVAPSLIPIDSFTRFDEFGGVKISPDGEFLAVLSGKEGRSQLAFIDLASRKVVSGVQTEGGSRIDTYRWVGANRLIYTMMRSSPSKAEPTRSGMIYAIDRDGSDHRAIYDGNSTVQALGATRSTDARQILVAEYPLRNVGGIYYRNPDDRRVITPVNVYGRSNELRWQQDRPPLGNAQLLLDQDDRLRFALGTNEDLWPAASWKPDADTQWQTFDLEEPWQDGTRPVSFSPDGRAVFLIGVRGREPFAALYQLDLQTRAISKVYGFDDADVRDVIMDFAGRSIIGVRGYAERPIEHWLLPEEPAAQTYAALRRAFPGQDVEITSASRDGRQAIVFVHSDTNPGDYYLFDTIARQAQFLRAARAWIEPKQMRPKEPITLAARDGLQLHGYVTRPTGEGPFPMVVRPHDGPSGERDTAGFDAEVQLLASRGYAVLQVNYRGSTGYGVNFEEAGDRQWGGKIHDDIADAARWAVAQRIARSDAICIYGTGYGGYAALMGVVRERNLYRCAIGYGGLYDLSSDASRRELGQLERRRIDRVLGTDLAHLRALSPVENAGSIEVPVLLIHGQHDWAVDYRQAERMKRALEWKHKKVELVTLAREGSTTHDEDSRRDVYERILQFLDANLRTSQPVASQ
jgi:dipeptidyl aminopeptidase/acylaminoacyl peptidase